ncbi:MAG: hypothetical protein DBY34_05825 [Oscillospiraceae bacterium]|nr:MAG: hypothetical protein DBY34_05825 [Oscillospiraceae bacterium]
MPDLPRVGSCAEKCRMHAFLLKNMHFPHIVQHLTNNGLGTFIFMLYLLTALASPLIIGIINGKQIKIEKIEI